MVETKRPITSHVTAQLLLLLLEGGKTSVELAKELHLFPSEVNAYLYYYKRRGLVTKSSDIWYLTRRGVDYVKEHLAYFKNLLNSVYRIKMNKDELILYSKSRIRKLALEWTGSNDCLEIVDFLADIYLKRGKTYFEAGPRGLIDSLAEALEEYSGSSYVSPFKLQECLAFLSQKGVVYIYRGRKIRLHKAFIQKALSDVSP